MRRRRSDFARELQENPLGSSGCTGCLPTGNLAVFLEREAREEETGRITWPLGREGATRTIAMVPFSRSTAAWRPSGLKARPSASSNLYASAWEKFT
jgi:hypothetical protein